MGGLGPGVVVVVRFPFSDLSSSKLYPALVLASAGGSDWVLCQITSNPYGDPAAQPMAADSFVEGGLSRQSFARVGKLFTANESIVVRRAGVLRAVAHRGIVEAVIRLLQAGISEKRRPMPGSRTRGS